MACPACSASKSACVQTLPHTAGRFLGAVLGPIDAREGLCMAHMDGAAQSCTGSRARPAPPRSRRVGLNSSLRVAAGICTTQIPAPHLLQQAAMAATGSSTVLWEACV